MGTKPVERKGFVKKVEKLFRKWETPMDVFDWRSEVDSKRSDRDNLEHIEERLRYINPDKFPDLPVKKEISEKEAEAMVEYVGRINEEFEKSIQNIRGKTTNVLDKYFSVVKENTEVLVKSNKIHGYILKGEPAIGKTHSIIQSLAQMKLKNEEDYVVLSSHITALELYQFLVRNNGKIIICDDVISLFKDDIKKGLLLACLWNPTGRRVIEYHTSSSKLKVQPKDEFTGKMIITCNKFPQDLESLKSRCLYQELKFNVKEKKKIIRSICELEKYPDEIFKFIDTYCDETTENLNFRLPVKLSEIYKNKPENWEKLAKVQIECDEKLCIIKKLIESGKSREEILEEWRKETGLKSQSRFYDYQSMYFEKAGFK